MGLAIEGEIAVKVSKRDVPGFPGYRFGLAQDTFTPIRKPIEALPATDKDGKAEIAVTLPAMPRATQSLEADVILKLRESGGRTIERTVTLPVDMRQPRVGIKPGFTNNQAAEDELATFDTLLLDAQGKAVAAKGLKWELLRLDQRWQWYSRDGSWNYEPITSTRRVAGGTVDSTATEPGKISARLGWGRYRLEVSSADGVISSYVFSSGYYADETADSPEVLDVALDKATYKAGDTARVKITSRMGGPRASCCAEYGPRPHAGGRASRRRRRDRPARLARLEPRRLYHRRALSPDGREGQAHAEPCTGPALAAHRPVRTHPHGQRHAAGEGEVELGSDRAGEGRGARRG